MVLFIVPDDDDENIENGEEAPPKQALLDTDEIKEQEKAPGEGDKVELDLEDAPFLDEEEEEEEPEDLVVPEEGEAPDLEGPSIDLDKMAARKKRLFMIIGAALGLLLILLILLIWSPWSEDEPEIPEPEPQEEVEEEEQVVEEEEPTPQEFIVSWEPFWVEHRNDQGKVRFLVCKFSAPTDNEKLSWELKQKTVVLRDAIFYYLRNKNLTFLSDKENVELLKADLLSVINQYLTNGRLENLLIEEYLVK